jgi:formylglycine-generating enzyme required for sulfatase activity
MNGLKAAFLDFHLIVNSICGEPEAGFVVVVAEAPVSRWGSRFDRLSAGTALESSLTRGGGVELSRDPDGALYLRWSGDGRDAGEGSPTGVERDVAGRRRYPRPRRRVTEIREALFSLLFPQNSQAFQLLARSCQRANLERKLLRLKLELAPALANLPWEMMRVPRNYPQEDELNRARLSLLRYLGDVSGESNQEELPGKPCVLMIRADPQDLANGQLRQSFLNEWHKVHEILRRHELQVDCEAIEGPDTLGKLIDKVRSLAGAGRPLVGLHFIGHGGVDDNGGFLVGEDRELASRPIYEDELRQALDRVTSLRWVIFNACSTAYEPLGCPLAGLATSMAVVKNVPTVIAYTRPVATTAAEALAAEFYKSVLDARLAIEDAVRDLQLRYENPGGLVVLARSVAGKVQTGIELPQREDQPVGGERGEGRRPPQVGGERQPGEAAGRPARPRVRPPAAEELGEMVLIPAGPFKKGLTDQQIEHLLEQFRERGLALELGSAREVLRLEPQEEMTLPAFWIDLTPITNAQFQHFVEATRYVTEAERRPGAPQSWRTYSLLEDHPVVFVSYHDAEAYCEWAGKRLPTADEWKKAYRGTEGRIYPWGETFDVNLCNTAESQQGWQTTPVRRFPGGRSPYGCFDMVGNVEEWTSTTHPEGSKLILGGSWCMTCQVYGLPVLHRLAARTFYSNEQGFRCARDAPAGG